MKYLFLALSGVLLVLSSSVHTQEPGTESLRAAMAEFCAKANQGDMDYIDQHYVPEATRFHSAGPLDVGWTEDKARAIKESQLSFTFDRCEVVDARVYGDTGVTAGYLHGHMTSGNGARLDGPWRFTYVWVQVADEWKEAHHHVSLLNQN